MARPVYSPIAHLDVNENESEAQLLRLQNVFHATFLGVVLCLSWNVFAVATAWMTGLVAKKVFLLAIICFLVGVPGAYLSWYHLLSRALRRKDGKDYDWALVLYLFYFSLWYFATLSPSIIYYEGKFITGMIPSIIILGENTLVGTLYLIGFLLFLVELVLSLWVFNQVWLNYRWIMSTLDLENNEDIEATIKDRKQKVFRFYVFSFTGFCLCFVIFTTVSS
ncbi:hypothetical protein HS088_TW21G01096 [Tripterygium wilfordii]|uniref:Secretory carrier-associated membrane protein n=1 Tax=Tripterygium wilfordii TaxID=458696 RepID=A0A7J7C494_TRIWF|nr:hypothetical protein HS088_TW21G01096 [Tripterygium wilfordii]